MKKVTRVAVLVAGGAKIFLLKARYTPASWVLGIRVVQLPTGAEVWAPLCLEGLHEKVRHLLQEVSDLRNSLVVDRITVCKAGAAVRVSARICIASSPRSRL